MSIKLPLASNILPGLMSIEDKIKLDSLSGSGSIPDPLSSSIQRTHQLSASYFSMSSGSFNNASGSTLYLNNLVVQNSNITGTVAKTFSFFMG
jgi:hypothetical protein